MDEESTFVSCFKINGRPIMSPIITDELRAELQYYREKAKQIEERIARLKSFKIPEDDLVVEDLEESINLIQLDVPIEEVKGIDVPKLPDVQEDQTSLFSLECKEKVVIIKEIEAMEQSQIDFAASENEEKILDFDSTSVPFPSEEHPEVEPSHENNLEKCPMNNDLVKKQESQDKDDFLKHRRLIRSKSYTLESPSQLLLEHLAEKGIILSASAPEVPSLNSNRLIALRTSKVKATTTCNKKLFPVSKTNIVKKSHPVSHLKSKKSPYDSKPNQKTLKKRKNQTNLDQKVLINKIVAPSKITQDLPQTILSPIQQLDKKIIEFQDQYNQKMLLLMRQQEEEHAKMQEKFKQQQEELLRSVYLIKPMDGNRTSTPLDLNGNNQFLSSSFSNLSSSQTLYLSNTITDADESITSQNFYTCINQELENTKSHKSSSPLNRSLQINEYMEQIKQKYQLEQNYDSKIQNAAATKINALARGFLTRRLYKTELVQSHIQTIRDTLIFVLDLHYETEYGPVVEKSDPADIFLKGRLLKQLQSACYKIHYIFILSTTKQRMDIIAKDRENLEIKRLSRNSSFSSRPRSNSTSVTANLNDKNNSNNLNPGKLQKSSLYSFSSNGDILGLNRPHTAIPSTITSKMQFVQNRPKTAVVSERISKSPAKPWR